MNSFSNQTVSSSEAKANIMDEVRREAAMANARQLVQKINDHCFDRCIPKPGASLSSGESACLTSCMGKYMEMWNAVSRQYITRIQREQGQGAATGGLF